MSLRRILACQSAAGTERVLDELQVSVELLAKQQVLELLRMTAKKRFWVSILAASIVGASFWLSAVIWPSRPITDPDPINRTIKIASQLAGAANDERTRNWLFTLILTNRSESAHEFARNGATDIERFQALLHIVDALATVGKTDESQKSLQQAEWVGMSISSADEKFSAQSLLFARKGRADEAFNQARQITDRGILSDTLAALSRFFIKMGDFNAAIRAAHADVNPRFSPRLLFWTAEALFDAGQSESGKALAHAAFALALELPGGGDDVLEQFAPVIVRAGLPKDLFEELQALEKRDNYISDQAFESVAIGFAELGDINQALAVARSISKDMPISAAMNDGRARALASVSQVVRKMRAKDEAEVILTEALDTALQIEFPAHRSWALHKIAPLLVKAGRKEEAFRAVNSIGIGDNEPLAFVAVALAESGNWNEAVQAANEAFASATNFENTIIRSGALLALVKVCLRANRRGDAQKFIETALQKLRLIKGSQFESDAYRLVAEAFALLGEWNQAIAMAELCEQKIDRLAACTAIVRELSIAQNPALTDVFKKSFE